MPSEAPEGGLNPVEISFSIATTFIQNQVYFRLNISFLKNKTK